MKSAKLVAAAGTVLCAVLWAATLAATDGPCSRYEHHGLAPGLTSKQVWQVMGGKGRQREVVIPGRGPRSTAEYVIDGAAIEVEYDGVVTRRNQARVHRVRTRLSERDMSYADLVQSLLESVGQPVEGSPEAADGPLRWIDETCKVQVSASRHLPDWWEPGMGPSVDVEVRLLDRSTAGLFSRSGPRTATANPQGARDVPTGTPVTAAATPPVVDAGTEPPGTADAVDLDNSVADKPTSETASPMNAPPGGEVDTGEAPPQEPGPSGAVPRVPVSQADKNFQAPVAINNPSPQYPDAARMRNLGGRVVLAVLVNEKGRVDDVAVSSSDGNKLLQDAAVRAVRRWRYRPATRDGVPVSAWTTVAIGFDPRTQ